MIRTLVAIGVFAASAFAQPRVSLENQGVHVLCVVPLVGTGTKADPIRPMFIPATPTPIVANAPSNIPPPKRVPNAANVPPAPPLAPVIPAPPIRSFQYTLSDDGKLALVDFVGSNLAGVNPILTSTDPNVRACFQRDTTPTAQIESAFQQYKATFTLNSLNPTFNSATAVAK